MTLGAVLAAPYLLVGLLTDEPYADRILQGGIVFLGVVALFGLWMWRKGTRLDREQDERERLIVLQAATLTLLATAVAVQTHWALRFAESGNAGDDFFWVLALMWGTFAASNVYFRLRN